jgi:ferredoxin
MSNNNEKIKCRFKVDRDLCIAVSSCIVQEPDIYLLDDEAKAVVKKLEMEDINELSRDKDGWVNVEVTKKGYDRIIESAQVCPVFAIIVDKHENGEWTQVYPL